MAYETLLLDADGTLLDFEKAEARGIEQTMKRHGLPFDKDILALYSRINKKCWEEFEQGLLTKEALLLARFYRLFDTLGIDADAETVRRTYQSELGKGAYLLDGAYEICERLAQTHDLYILTNGVSAIQYSRFSLSGLDRIVKDIFVSEEIGCQKPQTEYFERVFARIPGFCRSKALMVGDSLTADIQGGINAGVDVCWVNAKGLSAPEGMQITYEIRDIRDLMQIV